MGLLTAIFGNYSEKEIKRIRPLVDKVLSYEDEYRALSDAQLRAKTDEFKNRLTIGETLDDILPEAFAVCREAGDRVLNMRHFPVQILGGIVLHQGRISEMKTGEGKTLVATLPAYLNALTGKGVHIVTVNDYLAKRDSEWMGKLYRFLGLSVGLIIHDMKPEEKRKAYNADITYCTNSELGFDYLRDNGAIIKEQKVQREHNFAIVDEVDSILIDEARTPLIISGRSDKSSDLYLKANSFVKTLKMVRVKEMDDKASDEKAAYNGDCVIDERANSAILTPSGVEKAEKYFQIENLNDSENLEIAHHINQALRAHGVMQRDIDYVVKDGKIIIVDEFTGRLMHGRRFSEGLHQAIEAKEGVKIENESKTVATITYQNFFRLYKKLSGMTGTAMTEEAEFQEIYNLDVIEIPTNKPIARIDENDAIYATEKAKLNAIIERIIKCCEKRQPVLVGTATIEKSELLSSMLKKRGIKHNVLNAKNHEKEAEIIAQAGTPGAVTIATNMAGRGTDIMLGGNAEYMAKAALRHDGLSEEMILEATGFGETDNQDILAARKQFKTYYEQFKAQIAPDVEAVRQSGGLCIIGSERHESRRVDNQLRGRAGRQGDPGITKFYISFEDELLRLHGSEQFATVVDNLASKVDDNMLVEASILTKFIEGAQRRVEGNHFAIRKNVLEYDDVMTKQRELIYNQRNQVLNGENIKDTVLKMIDDTIDIYTNLYVGSEDPENWNISGLREHFNGWIIDSDDLQFTTEKLWNTPPEEISNMLKAKARAKYESREAEFGFDKMRFVERYCLLRSVDEHWVDHIDAMDQLRQGIGLRHYGQHNPLVEYRNESYDMFSAMTDAIRENTAKRVLTCTVQTAEEKRKPVTAIDPMPRKNTTVRGKGVVSKNAPCPCGSGKKYKRCCGKDEE